MPLYFPRNEEEEIYAQEQLPRDIGEKSSGSVPWMKTPFQGSSKFEPSQVFVLFSPWAEHYPQAKVDHCPRDVHLVHKSINLLIIDLIFLTLSLLSSKSVFSQPFKKQLYECCSEYL